MPQEPWFPILIVLLQMQDMISNCECQNPCNKGNSGTDIPIMQRRLYMEKPATSFGKILQETFYSVLPF